MHRNDERDGESDRHHQNESDLLGSIKDLDPPEERVLREGPAKKRLKEDAVYEAARRITGYVMGRALWEAIKRIWEAL